MICEFHTSLYNENHIYYVYGENNVSHRSTRLHSVIKLCLYCFEHATSSGENLHIVPFKHEKPESLSVRITTCFSL